MGRNGLHRSAVHLSAKATGQVCAGEHGDFEMAACELTSEAVEWINTNFPPPPGDCPADLDGDGDADYFFDYLDAFAANDLAVCDIDGDGDCDADDFFGYLDQFAQGC